jgi:hypothetical protein
MRGGRGGPGPPEPDNADEPAPENQPEPEDTRLSFEDAWNQAHIIKKRIKEIEVKLKDCDDEAERTALQAQLAALMGDAEGAVEAVTESSVDEAAIRFTEQMQGQAIAAEQRADEAEQRADEAEQRALREVQHTRMRAEVAERRFEAVEAAVDGLATCGHCEQVFHNGAPIDRGMGCRRCMPSDDDDEDDDDQPQAGNRPCLKKFRHDD